MVAVAAADDDDDVSVDVDDDDPSRQQHQAVPLCRGDTLVIRYTSSDTNHFLESKLHMLVMVLRSTIEERNSRL